VRNWQESGTRNPVLYVPFSPKEFVAFSALDRWYPTPSGERYSSAGKGNSILGKLFFFSSLGWCRNDGSGKFSEGWKREGRQTDRKADKDRSMEPV
jgi:hypothetical protein